MLIKFGEVLDVANEQLPFVAKTKKINKISELKLENGDIVFADAAEDKTVGKCTELFNIIDKIVISGLHTIPCRPQIAFATAYLGYFFNSPCYRTQLLPLMQGIKVLSLSKTALLQTDIFYPKDQSEQARIGTFFRHLDRLITLHQCNCNMATRPCEWSSGLRAIAWEQRKFEKIAIRSSAMAVCSRSLPGVEYEDIISEQGILNKDIKTKRAVKIGIKFLPGDVLFGKLRPYLKNWLLPDFTGVAVGDFWVLQPSEIDSQYLYYLIQTPAFQEVSNQSTGTKMPRADWNLVANSMFFLPQNDDEQTCIGTFFRQLDRLITLHQRKHILLT